MGNSRLELRHQLTIRHFLGLFLVDEGKLIPAVTSTVKTTYDIKITIIKKMLYIISGSRKSSKDPKHVGGCILMNQFFFGIIIGAILVIVLVGIIFTAYRLGQRSQYPIMLPSDEPTTETDKEGPAGKQKDQGDGSS